MFRCSEFIYAWSFLFSVRPLEQQVVEVFTLHVEGQGQLIVIH